MALFKLCRTRSGIVDIIIVALRNAAKFLFVYFVCFVVKFFPR